MKGKKDIKLFSALIFLLFISVLLGILIGSGKISLAEILDTIINCDKEAYAYRILVYVRLPRVLAALFAGMALSLSGVIIQGVLRNPLAGPNIIGVNSGAGFAAVIAMSCFPLNNGIVPAFAFLGAIAATCIIFFIASLGDAGKVTVILSGVTLSSILSAGIDIIRTINTDLAIDSMGFFLGGFSQVTVSALFPSVYYIVFAVVVTLFLCRQLDILGLGDEYAKTLGMNVVLVKFVLIILSSVLAGAAVSFSGLLGFVGLIVPHIIRRFTGNSHKKLIPASLILGGSFVVICDALSRVLFAPFEVPVGILMSLIGGPFFLVLIIGKKRY